MASVDVEAKEAAAREVQARLALPDQLARVPALIADYQRRSNGVDSQVSTLTNAQVEEVKEGMGYMKKCFDSIATVASNFRRIDTMCKESGASVRQYEMVRVMAIARRNLELVLRDLNIFLSVSEKAKELDGMLDNEDNLLQPESSLLDVQLELHRLELARARALASMEEGATERAFLEEKLQPVVQLADRFARILWLHIENAVTLARENRWRLLTVVRVIERQERIDRQLAEAAKAQGAPPAQAPKDYKGQCYRHMQLAVMKSFEMVANMTDEEDVASILEGVDRIVEEVETVADLVVPCFPEEYELLKFHAQNVHFEVTELYQRFVARANEVPPFYIDQLVRWARKYHERMAALGMGEEVLLPSLLDDVPRLLAGYLHQLQANLAQWASNIVSVDFGAKPEADPDGAYRTPGPTDLFRMVEEQLMIGKDQGLENGDVKFYVGLCAECVAILSNVARAAADKIDGHWAALAPELLMAMANNADRCLDYVNELQERVNGSIAEAREALEELPPDLPAEVDFSAATEGFVGMAVAATERLGDRIFRELEGEGDLFGPLFGPAWYEGEPVRRVLAPLRDFLDEARGGLVERFFAKLAVKVLDRLLTLYLSALYATREPLRASATPYRMEKDAAALRDFFRAYATDRAVDAYLPALLLTKELVEGLDDPDMIAAPFGSLAASYPGVPIEAVQRLYALRPDLKKQASGALEACSQVLSGMSASKNAEAARLPPNSDLYTRIPSLLEPLGKEKKKKEKKKDKDKGR
eukprot:tig00021123_g18493.t1